MSTKKKSTKTNERCRNCDAACSSDICFSIAKKCDLYLGRCDKDKLMKWYFCSVPCSGHHYRQEMSIDVKGVHSHLVEQLAFFKKMANDFKQDPKLFSNLMLLVRGDTSTIRFLQACMENAPYQVLLSLKKKALELNGEFMEVVHEELQLVNTILHLRLFVENFDIGFFCWESLKN